jgi:hypothetical protein
MSGDREKGVPCRRAFFRLRLTCGAKNPGHAVLAASLSSRTVPLKRIRAADFALPELSAEPIHFTFTP